MVHGVGAQEPHHLAQVRGVQGVGQREAQVLVVERDGLLRAGGVDDDVAELDRHRLPLLDLAVGAHRDVGGDLDRAALVVEEPEAVPAARGGQRVGLADELHAVAAEVLREGVDVVAVRGAEADEVEAFLRVATQPHRVLLGRAGGREERDAVVGRLRLQPPHARVELELSGVVGHGEVDVPQVRDEPIGHVFSKEQCAVQAGVASI